MDAVAATDCEVSEAFAFDEVRVIEVAAVEDDRLLEKLPHAFEIRTAKLLPLGYDSEGISAPQGLFGTFSEFDPLHPFDLARLSACHRIVCCKGSAR